MVNAVAVHSVHNEDLGDARVLRGGGWPGLAQWCRSAFRPFGGLSDACGVIGFSPVRLAP